MYPCDASRREERDVSEPEQGGFTPPSLHESLVLTIGNEMSRGSHYSVYLNRKEWIYGSPTQDTFSYC